MLNEEINLAWISWIETRVRRSLLDDKRKSEIFERLARSKDENELKTLLKEAEDNMPEMGYHVWPQGQGQELGEAIKNRVVRDDFYDRYGDK